ncbi:methyltransferase-like protein 13 [Selaginella moellendorffii]|uniref:methyltransferase-like protein 13 n=1 Tax=Selaginella moellendorffii TaxID=88036 RepID=UPI000D1CCFE9|nr:methyltransferase-like protein 13 [Selaginella moellendorffii]|eukprot:XP_024539085.1 methyltransferase-like protein 13 [Selaginella moellendorffii]
MKVDHSYLASPYHEGMVAGLPLIATKIESCVSSKEQIRVMIVGLGAGLLPMFLYKHFPFNSIEVVELDPVVADLAKRHFGFVEDDRMQLRLGDGLAAVDAIAKLEV